MNNIDVFVKKKERLENELTEAKKQLQKVQTAFEILIQKNRKIHLRVSDIFTFFIEFAELGETGLPQNGLIDLSFEDEAGRIQNILVLIKSVIHDAESYKRENEYLRKILKNNQNQ